MRAINLAAAVTVPVLLMGPMAAAEVGDLTYVGDAPIRIGYGLRIAGRTLSTKSIAPAAKGSGASGPKGEVATPNGSSRKISVALDLNGARVDFTGKAQFTGAPAVKLKQSMMSSFMFQRTYGPATITTSVHGKDVPVTVLISDCRSYIPRGQQQRSVLLEMAVMAVGRCRFGEKVHAVRVIDTNHTLRLGDPPPAEKVSPSASGRPPQDGWVDRDLVQIDTHNRAFRQADIQVVCGQSLQVDGRWYRLGVEPGGGSISATPARVEAGGLLIPKGKWSVLLLGSGNHLILSGGKAPVAVPADTYTAMEYCESVRGEGGAQYALTAARPKGKITVKPGQTVRPAVGSLLVGTVAVSQDKGVVALNLKLTDVAGNSVRLSGPKGYPPPPNVTVLDARGKEVHTATLKCG